MARLRRLSKQERHHRILDELRASAFVRISKIAERLDMSTETVRRDLDELSDAGLLLRAYGGAMPLPSGTTQAIDQSPGDEDVDESEAIGVAAAQRVRAGQTVMLSGGGIAQHTARALARLSVNLVVVTNSARVAAAVATNPTIQALLLPGTYDVKEDSVSGGDTIDYLQQFQADIAVVEGGVLTREGPYEEGAVAAMVKRAMLQRAARKLLVVSKPAQWCKPVRKVCTLRSVDEVIVYGHLEKAIAAAARKCGTTVSVVCADHSWHRNQVRRSAARRN